MIPHYASQFGLNSLIHYVVIVNSQTHMSASDTCIPSMMWTKTMINHWTVEYNTKQVYYQPICAQLTLK